LKNSPAGTPGNLIYTGIRTNQSPVDIKLSLRKDGAYDTDTLKVLDQQVDDAFNEFSAAQRNQLAGANQPAQRTPIQEWLDKNGLINPAQQYTAESLPADVNVDWAGMQGGKAQQDAFNEATMTGRKIGNINDERQALQNKAKVSNLVRTAQLSLLQGQADDRTNAPYVNPSTGAPVNFAGNMSAQANAITPRPRVDTGAVGGWLGAVTRPVKDAAAQVLNPGGDVARMAMLKAAARAQERRKTNLVRSVQSAPAYDQAVRQLAAQQVQQSGRTPARDAQRVLLNYMRQGGAAI